MSRYSVDYKFIHYLHTGIQYMNADSLPQKNAQIEKHDAKLSYITKSLPLLCMQKAVHKKNSVILGSNLSPFFNLHCMRDHIVLYLSSSWWGLILG